MEGILPKAIGAGAACVVLLIVFALLARHVARTVHDRRTLVSVRWFFFGLALLAAFFLVSGIFGERLGNFTVALGVLGAGVAVAAQEVVLSIAGWLAILFADFYRTGDRVQLGSIRGDVIQITMLRTMLMEIGEWVKSDQYTGRTVRVANSFVFKEAVINYTGQFPFVWDEFTVPIRYDSDREAARRMLRDVIAEIVRDDTNRAKERWSRFTQNHDIESARLEPMVTLIANDNWMEFTVRYIVDYRSRRTTKDEAFTRILEQIDASQGRISLASSTYQIVPPSNLAVDVNLRDGAAKS